MKEVIVQQDVEKQIKNVVGWKDALIAGSFIPQTQSLLRLFIKSKQ